MMGKSGTEAAKQIGCSLATVSRWARALKLGKKYGSTYVFSESDIKKIDKCRNLTPGQPKKTR